MINIEDLKSKNIHIVGLSGTEGAQLALFLNAKGCKNLTAHDFCDEEKFRENFMMFHGALDLEERKEYFEKVDALIIKKCFKNNYLDGVDEADLIFVSQGWYLYDFNKPKLFEAKQKGIPFYTILNLYLSICKAKTIGITGSNGKTTTSRLIYETLKLSALSSQFSVLYVGNDRGATQDLFGVEALNGNDFLVLEISNRQLKLIEDQSPNIGIVTNITENHMNEHESLEEYAKEKSKIWQFQQDGDFAIVNLNDDMSRHCLDKMDFVGHVIGFGTDVETKIFLSLPLVPMHYVSVKNDQIFVDNEFILNISDIKIPGKHNLENVLAAVGATYFAGVKTEIIKEEISNFTGVEKRLEFIGGVNGIKFYNDLASTTPTSTIAAIETFKNANSITLILGGDDKNLSYSKLAYIVLELKVNIILMNNSSVSNRFYEDLHFFEADNKTPNFLYKNCDNILQAFQIAKENTKRGGIVLLSPAGEGFFSKFLNRRTGGMSLEKALQEIK